MLLLLARAAIVMSYLSWVLALCAGLQRRIGIGTAMLVNAALWLLIGLALGGLT